MARAALAEAAGVFALVLVGCGAAATDAVHGGLGGLGVALAFGLVIMAMVYALGHVSGAHLNPAVSVALAATGHFPWRRVPVYVAAQAAGATCAAFLLRWLFGDAARAGVTAPVGLGMPQAFVIEAAFTALLMFTIAAVATDRRAPAGVASLAIGAAVAFGSLAAGPWTGASMNPARSLGPALASGGTAWLPLYVVGPLVGALAGAMAYAALRPQPRARRTADPSAVALAPPGPGVAAPGTAPPSTAPPEPAPQTSGTTWPRTEAGA